MKKDSEYTEKDNPVLNAVFIGLYVAALIALLVTLFRRFLPAMDNVLENFIAL